MARLRYRVTAPDGTSLERNMPDYVIHHWAVIGYMRLRHILSDKQLDEGVEYNRFKAWVMVGTTETHEKAEALIETQAYKNVTEETLILEVTGELVVGDFHGRRKGIEEDEDSVAEVAASI